MNRKRMILTGVLALMLAGLLTLTAFRILRKSVPSVRITGTRVLVAAADLPVGTKLEARFLKTMEVTVPELPPGVLRDPREAIGRGIVVPMAMNEMLLASKLAPEGAGAGLPTLIPPNMRAVSVKVNEVVSVAGFVGPGTRVDVLLTGKPSYSQTNEVLSTTVLQNVEVLAAGQKIERTEEGKPQTVTVITLLVSLDDAEKLVLASSEGKIQLALRHPFDMSKEEPPTIKQSSLYQLRAAPDVSHRSARKVLRVASPQPPLYVELIRGDKREVAKLGVDRDPGPLPSPVNNTVGR